MLLVTRNGRQPAHTAHTAKNGSAVVVVISAVRPFPKVVRGGTVGQTQRWGFSLGFPAPWPAFTDAPTKKRGVRVNRPISHAKTLPGHGQATTAQLSAGTRHRGMDCES